MPCRCDDYPQVNCSCSTTIAKMKKRLDEATRLLCYLCGELESDGQWKRYSNVELITWRERHHKRDAERVRRRMDEVLRKRLVEPDKLAKKFIDKALAVHPVSRWHKQWFLDMAKEACRIRSEEMARKGAKDAMVKKALDKLTKDERRMLGL